ncbi:MAG TPA: hypothetical protein VEN99_11120 [Acidimicrobiia bacterium]|nr:hypothetical protein [Acidimicrobiia bacterium]
MHIRTDGGWIRAGLAVLVAGVLGGGVLAAACGTTPPHKVTADGVSGKSEAASAKPLDLAAGPASSADDGPKADPVVGDKVNVGSDGGSVTVSAVEDNVSAGRLFGAGEGRKYVAAEVKGCSGPHEKDLRFEPSYFLVQLDDKTVHDPGPGAKKPELTGGTVPAGRCLSGWVTFTVPDGGLPAAVIYDGSSRLTWTVPLPKGAKPTTTTTLRPGATTTTTAGSGTTTSTRPKTTTTTARATTTTTVRAATTARATTTTTTAKGATTTTGKPAPTSTTTTTPKPTTTTTAAVATAPTAPTG